MQHSPYTPGAVATKVPGRAAQLTDLSGLLARVATEHDFAGRVRVEAGRPASSSCRGHSPQAAVGAGLRHCRQWSAYRCVERPDPVTGQGLGLR